MMGAISNQHMALTFGTGALIAAFGAGVLSWEKTIAPAIFIAIVPLSWWILTMWIGEVVRMLRAVEFCGDQEQLINESITRLDPSQPQALRWESWRRDEEAPWRTSTWTYKSVALLLLLTNLAAGAGGTVTAVRNGWTNLVVALVWMLTLACGAYFARWVRKIYRRWTENAEVGIPALPG